MTPTQIDFLRDFAIDNLTRAQSDRKQTTRFGGNFYDKLAFTSSMVRGNAGATATEHAAAAVLECVCLLRRQLPLLPNERADVRHNLTDAANGLCLHTGKTIAWLAQAALESEPPELPPAIPQPLPPIAGRFLSTAEAAKVMGFAVQTLRMWSSTQTGPIQPISKVGRRLKWSGDKVLSVMAKK